ncbi:MULTISPECIES: FxLD family lanthipeptide [unclassified Streptomyces]|uniref:FxLD family lanthipeptide n=1 Tax=unclassified Streptomyces TaxID=2593676 RepID=UPI002DD94397|nr:MULTISPECIES: FxLD family lanthipeptide [unclassified Streptomyces]WSA91653.1 FxLD family lanthipeptide [Streptomyces sp. NBC_01795]WSB76025.1 FxLD family lanthipeptide [Streptomyces sp. NBC_01775]WSS15701.1 FxLD family lanthipeptide [Streptomyces sp. NBC_01186]WSS44541.1 FxLD family lanthipeptide [Streptomyces sp. NBC_01187]
MSTATAMVESPPVVFAEDDFAPLDVKVVVAAHPHGKLMCQTGDGCGNTCSGGASACSSFIEDPA